MYTIPQFSVQRYDYFLTCANLFAFLCHFDLSGFVHFAGYYPALSFAFLSHICGNFLYFALLCFVHFAGYYPVSRFPFFYSWAIG